MTNPKTNSRKLDLEKLEKVLLSICETLNMSIRKSMLHKIMRETFEYSNSTKSIDFAILDLVEQGLLVQTSFYICSPDCALSGRTIPSATEEGIIKYLTSKQLKEDIRNDLFFSPVCNDLISPHNFFKYIKMKYPMMLAGDNMGLTCMEQLNDTFAFGLTDTFYVEYNDYPYGGDFFKSFFSEDSRIILRSIEQHKKYVVVNLFLFPGKKRSYQKAHQQFQLLQEKFGTYYKGKKVHFKTTPLSMIIGNKRRY